MRLTLAVKCLNKLTDLTVITDDKQTPSGPKRLKTEPNFDENTDDV